MGYDQLNPPILRDTPGKGMRYIGCTRRTRKTDAHRTLKYVLIILACRALYPPNPFRFPHAYIYIYRRNSPCLSTLGCYFAACRPFRFARFPHMRSREERGWRCSRTALRLGIPSKLPRLFPFLSLSLFYRWKLFRETYGAKCRELKYFQDKVVLVESSPPLLEGDGKRKRRWMAVDLREAWRK